jgi:hypothetical protein
MAVAGVNSHGRFGMLPITVVTKGWSVIALFLAPRIVAISLAHQPPNFVIPALSRDHQIAAFTRLAGDPLAERSARFARSPAGSASPHRQASLRCGRDDGDLYETAIRGSWH